MILFILFIFGNQVTKGPPQLFLRSADAFLELCDLSFVNIVLRHYRALFTVNKCQEIKPFIKGKSPS